MFKRRNLLLAAAVVVLLVASAVPIIAQDSVTAEDEAAAVVSGGVVVGPEDMNEAMGYYEEESFDEQSIAVGGGYDPTVLTKWIPGDAFIPDGSESDTVSLQNGSCIYPGSNSAGSIVEAHAPIELPQGALLTGVTFYGNDSNAANMTFNVLYSRVYTPGLGGGTAAWSQSILESGSSSGLAGPGGVFVDVDPDVAVGSTGNFFTGFTNHFYSLKWLGTIAAGTGHSLCGARVTYQVPATGDNQTFTPIEPCAIYDSRTSQGGTGSFSSNETRSFTVTGDTSGVGGDGVCGINTAATAVQVNVLVLSPGGTGTLKAWASGGTEPAGLVAFTNELSRWNGSSSVPISTSDQMALKMQNSAGDVRLVATGYFSPVSNMGN